MPLSRPPAIPLIILTGATGTGKSALALSLADKYNGVIINGDSRQFYEDFPIITAQPDKAEQALAPHRLYGFVPCQEKLSAGQYMHLAREEIAQVHAKEMMPIVVGGSGLYLQTLVQGIAPIPPVDPAISRHWQKLCKEKGAATLYEELRMHDPVTAKRLHPNDSQRIIRALEVLQSTGQPLSYWHRLPLPPSPYRRLSLQLDIPLDELTPILEKRIDAMIDAGAIEEAKAAMEKCPDPKAPGWSGIGCAELYHYLNEALSLETCKSLWLQNTRHFAKRQITWMRRERRLTPCRPDEIEKIFRLCERFTEDPQFYGDSD